MSGDKTEEPTEHKLREARKKGQVTKSQDIIAASIFLLSFFVIYLLGSEITGELRKFLTICFMAIATPSPDVGLITKLIEQSIRVMFITTLPVCAVAFVVAFAANYVQIGTLITFEPLKPDLKKLNPVDGFKNLFKMRKLIELLKSTLKITIVSLLAYMIIKDRLPAIVLTTRMPLWDSIKLTWDITYTLSVRIGVVFGVLAAADWYYQKWQFNKDMMMSKKEVKDEHKNSEGDPHIKAQRKALHQEMAMNSATQETRKADAVVVNPDHIAVAIRYDKDTMNAPRIIAKGQRLWAEKMKQIAKEEGIPILRNVPLASALNKLETGEDVPEELYDAVAEILQFVYQLAAERGEAK